MRGGWKVFGVEWYPRVEQGLKTLPYRFPRWEDVHPKLNSGERDHHTQDKRGTERLGSDVEERIEE